MPLSDAVKVALVDLAEGLALRVPAGEAICLGCGARFPHGDVRPCTCTAKVLVGGRPPRVEAA